jgi:hypothetical protein
MATSALDLIKGALRRINSYQTGEQLAAPDANDALETLNDLLDSWSTDKAYVYGTQENVLFFVSGQYQYSIGPGGDFAADANTGAAIGRPLRVTSAYTRFSGLDFWMDVNLDEVRYNQILLKSQPSPWPLVCWYNTTWPLGLLNFYPTPSGAAELHLFSDQILVEFATLNTPVSLPQGYARAIKWALAKELCAEYGFPMTDAVKTNAQEAISMIKSLNQNPTPVSRLDDFLSHGNQAGADWIMHGGFAGT